MPYVGRDLQRGNYLKLDDISSSFNGSTTTFNLTSGGNAFFPGSAFSIIVSLGGVVQEPESAFQIDRSQIIFATAPSPNDDFFCIVQGMSLGVGVPGHNTVGNDHLAKPLSYGDYFRWDSANNRVGINTLLPSVALDVVGDATFSGNVSIGATLTYDDVANIDSVGLITARAGIKDQTLTAGRVVYTGTGGRLVDNSNLTYSGTSIGVPQIIVGSTVTANSTGLNVTGIGTFREGIFLPDEKKAEFGNVAGSADLQIYHSPSNSNNSYIKHTGTGALKIAADHFRFRNAADNTNILNGITGGAITLYFAGNEKLKTTSDGIEIPDTINHLNDTNTKIRFPADDTVTVETAGNERLRIDSNGNIGVNCTPSTSGTLYDTVDHFLVIGDNDTGIAQDGDGQFEIWANQQEIINFSTAGIDPKKSILPNQAINIGQTSQPISHIYSTNITLQDKLFHQGDTDTFLEFGTNTISFDTAGSERLRITSNGNIEIGSAAGTGSDFSLLDGVIINAANGDAGLMVNSSSSSHNAYISFSYGSGSSTSHNDQFSAYIGRVGDDTLILGTNNGIRWKIDSSGHFIPNTAGAVNIGSATAEIGNVYIADSKHVYWGSDQDLAIVHDGTHGYIHAITGGLYMKVANGEFLSRNGNDVIAKFLEGTGGVELWYNNVKKFDTVETGIQVTGEVAASQDYPNIRPVLDFNFAATKKLKPEMTFARVGEASFHDGVGSVKFVSDNEPRFEHDIVTGECKGLMFEGAGTNYSWYSTFFKSSGYSAGMWVPQNGGATPTITENTHTAPDGTSSGEHMADTITGATGTAFNGNVVKQEHTAGAAVKHTLSIYIKLLTSTQATIYIRDGATGSTASASAIPNIRNWQRVVVTSNNALTNATAHAFYIGNTNGTIAVWGSQIERSDYVTSYIRTPSNTNGTRNTDKGVHLDGEDVTDVFNDGRGTLIAEVILTQSQSNNPIVGFYENFTDDNRVEVRGDASSVGVARLEAVVSDSSVVSMTTGLSHSGVNNVSKYAYAFEVNNYAGCVNGGTVATDTNGAFPSGMNSMMIGEAVYNVDAAVIVKRIMYYADRLPNSQLVTLTS